MLQRSCYLPTSTLHRRNTINAYVCVCIQRDGDTQREKCDLDGRIVNLYRYSVMLCFSDWAWNHVQSNKFDFDEKWQAGIQQNNNSNSSRGSGTFVISVWTQIISFYNGRNWWLGAESGICSLTHWDKKNPKYCVCATSFLHSRQKSKDSNVMIFRHK